MTRDEAGIGSAAEQDRALPHMPRSLDLDPRLSGLLPDRADDACAPVVEGMIRSAHKIEPTFRFLHGERIALLVEAVRRHRYRRCTALRRHAFKFETPLIERCQDRIASARNAAQRRTLHELGHV